MKISHINRIYLNEILIQGKCIVINDNFHYLKTVLRLRPNYQIRVFNERDGEYLAKIAEIHKSNLTLEIENQLRKPVAENYLALGICMIKQDRMMDAFSMAVQLGVSKILPIISTRVQVRNFNEEKALKCIIEATEQSERLSLAKLLPIIEITKLNETYDFPLIIYANENEEPKNNIKQIEKVSTGTLLLVGPEGGFTAEELDMLSLWSNTKSVSLGDNVLRAETAAASLIAQTKLFM